VGFLVAETVDFVLVVLASLLDRLSLAPKLVPTSCVESC